MSKIKIISSLDLNSNGLQCKDKSGKYKSVLLRQGTMDGACATYSVMMNLLILRAINKSDTDVYAEHKSKATKKLFDVFCNSYGMHRNGQSFVKIKKMLTESFQTEVICERRNSDNEKSIDYIKDFVLNDLPVVISVETSKFAHALLAIGIEYEEIQIENVETEIVPTKIFCLDPSGTELKNNYWNSLIVLNPKTKGKKYKYHYLVDNEVYNVSLKDILLIQST
jgi:hypothetical protein